LLYNLYRRDATGRVMRKRQKQYRELTLHIFHTVRRDSSSEVLSYFALVATCLVDCVLSVQGFSTDK
jgi:hypothetical protein